ncbi:protein Gemin2 [Drosophila pseudoobscura]|uniref:Gem-associated protein 2 n=1 Tax=Drosophila pseudoobscura pseudoobscura TaxID=46245 RepID=A0A6I8UBL9_DROPS|nr:protein Gemin2 [Drosophila pseudoobscura]
MEHDAEEQSFQLQALEIREPDAGFDPQLPPQTGEEYLMHMLYERKRCPAVVTKRSSKIKKDVSNRGLEMLESMPLPPHKCLLPTPEWRNEQAKSFQSARAQVLAMREELTAHNYDQSAEPPLTSDIVKWEAFCREKLPLLSTLLHLSQSDLEYLLEMLSQWLQAEETVDLLVTDAWLGRWLYATLVCLHLPLEPFVFSTLRGIARSCIQLRNKLSEEEVKRAAPYNLIITLIVQVFAQSDLNAYL